MNIKGVSTKQLERYPVYLKYLTEMRDSGVVNISSPIIARALGLTEEQVRKDLQVVTTSEGKPKSGRNIRELISDIQSFLGYNDSSDAVIVGCGRLGQSFMEYEGFLEYGVNILAGFDVSTEVIGKTFNGKIVFSNDRIENLIPRLNVHIAILTVPNDFAQEVTDLLVKSGILAIWNFTSVHLSVPEGIIVQNVNLESSFAILSHKLKVKLEKENE